MKVALPRQAACGPQVQLQAVHCRKAVGKSRHFSGCCKGHGNLMRMAQAAAVTALGAEHDGSWNLAITLLSDAGSSISPH